MQSRVLLPKFLCSKRSSGQQLAHSNSSVGLQIFASVRLPQKCSQAHTRRKLQLKRSSGQQLAHGNSSVGLQIFASLRLPQKCSQAHTRRKLQLKPGSGQQLPHGNAGVRLLDEGLAHQDSPTAVAGHIGHVLGGEDAALAQHQKAPVLHLRQGNQKPWLP